MDLQKIQKERKSWMSWKNIAPLRLLLQQLPEVIFDTKLLDIITITCKENIDIKAIKNIAQQMKPWRKGPFDICNIYIDAEWKSYMKYNLLRPYFNLYNKKVADIGCNNGYYLFRMLEDKPTKLVGFDPSPLYKTQFDFINHFIKSDIVYELLGVEHVAFYHEKFDIIFCLGVLYHRSDPVDTLKSLYKGLEKNGELILDTFYIQGEEEIALVPAKTYSKIPNVYFIPTINTLKNWSLRAGFSKFEILQTSDTSINEQRKTKWIDGESLNNFLDSDDSSKTVEGYPAPKRVYVKLYKERKYG